MTNNNYTMYQWKTCHFYFF